MIHVRLTLELPDDDHGPQERYEEQLVLPPEFAKDAAEAHAKLLAMIEGEAYFELPRQGGTGLIPVNSGTVRSVRVWEE